MAVGSGRLGEQARRRAKSWKSGAGMMGPPMEKVFHVYMLAGKSGVLYTGVTSNLVGRVYQHKQRKVPGFTQKYRVGRLVWFEVHGRAISAIEREKEIKS